MSEQDAELEKFLKRDADEALYFSVRVANIIFSTVGNMPTWAVDQGLPPPKTIGDLLVWRESDLCRLPKFGAHSAKEVRDKLAERGLSLREKDARPTTSYPKAQINIIDPVSKILNLLSPFPPSVRTRIVRALRSVVGD
jgi:hypothetical protein